MRQGAMLVFVLVVAAAALAWSSDPSASQTSEAAKVLRVAEAGRAAVLEDRSRDLCRLLTRRAQRNSRGGLDYKKYAKRRRLPATCVSGANFEIDQARRGLRDFKRAQRNPALASLRVIRIGGNRARVRLSVPTPDGQYSNDADILFVRTSLGWRADSATFSPWDGSSGL